MPGQWSCDTSEREVQSISCYSTSTCLVWIHLSTNPTNLTTIYRPPKINTDFLKEFSAFLTVLCSLYPNVILLGDFNIHMGNTTNPLTKDFTSCLYSFGLQQFINFPAHSKAHILDLICCSRITPLHCVASDLPISDHKLVSVKDSLPIFKTNPSHSICFRNIKNIVVTCVCYDESTWQPP